MYNTRTYSGEEEIVRDGVLYVFDIDYKTVARTYPGNYYEPPYTDILSEDLSVNSAFFYDENDNEVMLSNSEIEKFKDELLSLAFNNAEPY